MIRDVLVVAGVQKRNVETQFLALFRRDEGLQARYRGPCIYDAGGEEVCDEGVGLEGLEDGEDAGYAVVLE